MDDDNTRLAIVALLTALIFGILTYYGDQKFNSIGFDSILKVIALVFKGSILFIFLIYIVTLGISKSHSNTKIKPIHHYFYDLGIASTTSVIFMAVVISLGIKLSVDYNNPIPANVGLLIAIFGGAMLFNFIFRPYLKDVPHVISKKLINLFGLKNN